MRRRRVLMQSLCAGGGTDPRTSPRVGPTGGQVCPDGRCERHPFGPPQMGGALAHPGGGRGGPSTMADRAGPAPVRGCARASPPPRARSPPAARHPAALVRRPAARGRRRAAARVRAVAGRPAGRLVARHAHAPRHDVRRRARRAGVRRLGAHPRAAPHLAPARARRPALDAAGHRATRRGRDGRGQPPAGADRRRGRLGAGGARVDTRRPDSAHPQGRPGRVRRRRPADRRAAPGAPADHRRGARAHLLRTAARNRAHLRARRRGRAARADRRPGRRRRSPRADPTVHRGARPGIRA